MPGGDRTGPSGFGPMTGRAAGFCAGYPSPGYSSSQGGMGMGRGRGGGRGFGRGFRRGGVGAYPSPAPTYVNPAPFYQEPYLPQVGTASGELGALRSQAEILSRTLEDIGKRIESLERKEAESDES
ncbi:MAG: DUF5320 domain-containing protein [Candidatus Latescibacteria bacterium]|nr:DUF5320 domain-containing protein [Candidatus Latescibacterota bacterium]